MNQNNSNQKRLNKAKGNVRLFLGTTTAMIVTTGFMGFATGMSYGTMLAAALVGVFCGLTLASRRRVDSLEGAAN